MGAGLWGSPRLWGSQHLWGSFTPSATTPVPGIISLSPTRTLVDYATFFVSYMQRPGTWNVLNTDGIRPTIQYEDKLRRVHFLNKDIVSLAPLYDNITPTEIQYNWKTDEDYIMVKMWTRVGRIHATKMDAEIERIFDTIRKDTFGNLPGDVGCNWLKLIQVSRGEQKTRKYWYREYMIVINRRYRTIHT